MSAGRIPRLLTALTVTMMILGLAQAAGAQTATNCPPGQPDGRPPGQQPKSPGQPDGRPPQYPPGRCNLALSQGSVDRGQKVGAKGSGFVPGETVALSLASGASLGTLTADGNGVIAGDLAIPADAAIGLTQVRAAGAFQTVTADLEITIPGASRGAPRTAVAGNALALTGVQIGGIVGLGVGLTAAGVAFVLIARRRRETTAAA